MAGGRSHHVHPGSPEGDAADLNAQDERGAHHRRPPVHGGPVSHHLYVQQRGCGGAVLGIL